MKIFGRKKGAAAAIEQEIAALEKRRKTLQTRFDAANHNLEMARIDRRNQLIGADENEATGVDKIEMLIATAMRDVEALRDALDEIENRLAAARQQLEFARDDDEREQRAAACDRAADDISKKATALEAATDALAIALADFVKAIPDDVGLVTDHNGFAPPSVATPAELAGAVISQGLCMATTDIFEARRPHSRVMRPTGIERALAVRVMDKGRLSNFLPGHQGENVEILPTRLAVQQILVEPLRDKARVLRGSSVTAEAAE